MSHMTGGCLCGQSRYAIEGQPKFAIRCYCRDCQRVSGGGHMPQIAVEADGFEAQGSLKEYGATSDAGNQLTFSFCGGCGSPLFKTTSMAAALVFVNAGTLDDPSVIDSFKPVYEGSRQIWDE